MCVGLGLPFTYTLFWCESFLHSFNKHTKKTWILINFTCFGNFIKSLKYLYRPGEICIVTKKTKKLLFTWKQWGSNTVQKMQLGCNSYSHTHIYMKQHLTLTVSFSVDLSLSVWYKWYFIEQSRQNDHRQC